MTITVMLVASYGWSESIVPIKVSSRVCFGLEVNTLQLLQEVKAYIDDKRISPVSKISA